MYREQDFVERCICDAPVHAPCASCGSKGELPPPSREPDPPPAE